MARLCICLRLRTTAPAALLCLATLAALAAAAGGAAVPLSGEGKCPEGYWMCMGGEGCVPAEARCDGTPHCADSTDEFNCTSIQPTAAAPEAETAAAAVAAPGEKESLEMGSGSGPEAAEAVEAAVGEAQGGGCLPDEHRCLDGTCISKERICDGPRDCFDGSDEDALAGCPPLGECRNDFRCADGRCVPFEWVCNNDADCSDKSDEDPALCANWTMPQPQPILESEHLPLPDAHACSEVPHLEFATSSGDPCERMEPSQRQHCWEDKLHNMKVEELQLRQRAARQQLEAAQAEAAAAKELRQEQLQMAQLQRQAAFDLLQQQTELHHVRLQALQRALGEASPSTEPAAEAVVAEVESLAATE